MAFFLCGQGAGLGRTRALLKGGEEPPFTEPLQTTHLLAPLLKNGERALLRCVWRTIRFIGFCPTVGFHRIILSTQNPRRFCQLINARFQFRLIGCV
jgi:hypothetical protein